MRFAGLSATAMFLVLLAVCVTGPTLTAAGNSPESAQVTAATPQPATMLPPRITQDPIVTPGVPPGVPVDINSASAAELGKVKFIGRKRAVAIIAGRPWQSTDDLVAKKVIPSKYYERIKDHLVAK